MVNDDDIKNSVAELKQQQLQGSMFAGVRKEPDTEAKLQALAKRTGLPVDVVRIKQPEVELQDKLKSFDYDKINNESPKTGAWLSDPNNAAIAHDDVENMRQIERTLAGTLGDIGVTAAKGAIGLPQAIVGIMDIPTLGYAGKWYEHLGIDFKGAQEIAATMYSAPQQRAQQAVQNADGFIDTVGAAVSNPSTIATAVGESIPQMLGGAAVARLSLAAIPKIGALAAGAIGEGVIGAGSSAENIRSQTEDGLLNIKQAISAVGSGVMTSVFGLMGGKLAQRFGIDDVDAALARGGLDKKAMETVKTGFVKSLVGGGISEGVFEELPQSMQEQMWQNFALGRPIGEGVGNAAAMGLLSGGVMGSGFQIVRHFANSDKAQKAEDGAAMLDQISELATASKLAQRNPESFQQFIAAAAENGPVENVYIDAKTLAQSGIAGELAKISPAVAEQLDRALVGNSQVAIPIAEYAAKIAPSEYAQALRDHLRTDPEGFTPAEAVAYMKDAAPQLQAEMAKVLESKNIDDTFKQSMQVVKQAVLDEMNTAGRFTPAKNEADATLVASYYAVRAQQMGITPEELFNRRRLSVGAERIGGQQLDQSIKDYQIAHKPMSIEGGASPLHDLMDAFGEDIYGKNAEQFFGSGDTRERKTIKILKSVRNKPDALVTIYRGVPNKADKINAGDWVTLDKSVAQDYVDASLENEGIKGKIISQQVPASHITSWPDSLLEFGYYPPVNDLPTTAELLDPENLPNSLRNLEPGMTVDEGEDFDPAMLKDQAGGLPEPGSPDAVAGQTQTPPPNRMIDTLFQSAFHGSPFRFDKFTLDHIGKGEGAQAFGWGLYFAGNKEIAEYYREQLRESPEILSWSFGSAILVRDGQYADYSPRDSSPLAQAKALLSEDLLIRESDIAQAFDKEGIESARNIMIEVADERIETATEDHPEIVTHLKVLKKRIIEDLKFKAKIDAGQLYEANIPDDSDLLQWDKPLDKQPIKVKKILKDSGLWKELKDNLNDFASPMHTRGKLKGENIYAYLEWKLGSDEAASKRLNELGIPGLKYPAGTIANVKSGSFNYVIFDDSAIEILKTYYQSEGAAPNRGAFNPETLQITLLKNADLSTFLHESGHFFFENDIALASDLVREVNDITTLAPGEQQIARDVSALLKWHGIQGTIQEQLAQWHSMDFEEKRSSHERTAESFEKYLIEGKAPSIELHPYFQTFRAWLLNVYKSLKDFLAGHPEAGQLNDEVRGIFDRMLATDDQIALAEQSRSMMPLFTTAEEAGFTLERFAKYQATGKEATATAVQELDAKGLKDMQWSQNKRGKVLKKLQKEHAEKRREVRAVVRVEVMSQPVYRAWQFLTNRASQDDKLSKASKPDSNQVDEKTDSLFTAIAKLGGLNRAMVEAEFGLDPAEKSPMPIFGKYVLRTGDAGFSPDAMAEKLSDYGYLDLDEHGKWEISGLEDKVMAELRGEPQYSVGYDYANAQENRAGDQVANPESLGAGRLDRASLADMDLPVDVLGKIDKLKMVKSDALHPDIVADLTGFNSGDEMVRALAAAPTPKEAIEAATDQRMLETYGELSQPGALERAADLAVHNEVRTKMYVTEANALAKATGKPKILAEAAKNFASEMISRKKIKDIRPLEYTHAETRAAKLADKAMRAGDLVVAAGEARNKVINGYAVKAAYAAQEEARKILKKWAEFANRSDKKLGKAYDIDLVNAVRAVLGEYGIAPRMAKKGSEYLKAVEQYDPEVFGIVRQSVAQAEANAKPVKELTMEELRGLRDEIDSIIHLAKRMHQSEVDGKLLDIQDIEDDLLTRLNEIGVPGRIPGEGQAVTPGEQAMIKFKSMVAFGRRVESWAGAMDGKEQMGPFRRYIWNRISDAAIKYRTEKGRYLKQYRDLIKTIAPTLKPQIINAPELGYSFGKGSGGSAVNEIVHAILHTGNESNKRKLLLGREIKDGPLAGRKWADELPDGTLDTTRWDQFINRMVQEGKITKAHFDFAQGVWDLLDSTKEMAQKTHRDVFGKYFNEVTATSFQTPFGNYRGGYVPAMVDSRVVKDAAMRELADKDNAAMTYAFPTTPKGFTKARVEYNKPLMLDLRTLSQHIDKVLLFSNMEMPVRDVQRIMSKQVGETLNRVDPVAIPAMISPWLFRSARQQVETPVSGDFGTMRFFSVMRTRAGMAAMFGNLANTVQQLTGFSLAAIKVKPKLLVSATADYLKAPREFTASVAAASPYMASRMENEVAVMNNEISDILLNPSLIKKGEAWTLRHAYFMQAAVDNVMSPIIWTAAYNQAVERGADYADAARLGDSAVRETQGAMQAEDISRIESGNAFARMFTQFAGYFNMNANLLGTEFVKMMRDGGLRTGKGLYLYTFGLMIPAVMGELIIQAFRGGPDDEDKDGEFLDDWIAATFGWGQLRYVTAMVPGIGQGINAIANAGNSKPYDDRIATSPAISMLESMLRSPWSVYNAATGEASAQKAVRDVATLISMSLGIPASFAARPIGYMAGVADDRIEPLGPVDATRGMMTGFASYESRQK